MQVERQVKQVARAGEFLLQAEVSQSMDCVAQYVMRCSVMRYGTGRDACRHCVSSAGLYYNWKPRWQLYSTGELQDWNHWLQSRA